MSDAERKRVAVHRNLNERGAVPSRVGASKRLRSGLDAVREERRSLLHRQARRVGREICSDSYKLMIQRFEEVFIADLAHFMTQLSAHHVSGMVENLRLRLDWNGFIASSA